MTMTAPPAKTAISDTYPLPTNATARTGFGALWDYVTGLLGSTGFTSGMLSASRILDPDAIYNLSLVPSVAGNALTMTLKSLDGSTALAAGEPATVAQRNATLATGTVLLRNITANISTVISSGSTAGHSSGVLSPIYWYLIDNAGTQELAWSTTNYGVKGIVSTTAEGGAGAADSAVIMYSTTARSNVAFRRIGRTFDSQATAGTWTAAPTTVELEPLDVGPANAMASSAKLINGFTYANAAGDVTNDIDIAAGGAMDSTGAYWMTGAAATKQLDAAWAVGSGAGGLDTGSIGNSDYYIWVIARPDTGVVDYLFSLSSTAPTMPTNYSYKRLIGWFKRVSAAIVLFNTYETEGGGVELLWSAVTRDVNVSAGLLTASRRTDAVKVPLNFSTIALLNVEILDASVCNAYIYCPDMSDQAPTIGNTPGSSIIQQVGGNSVTQQMNIRTSSTGTIAARAGGTTVDTYNVYTLGFRWARRN